MDKTIRKRTTTAPAVFEDYYDQGFDAARVQIDNNIEIWEKTGDALLNCGRNILQTFTSAGESYLMMTGYATEAAWGSLAAEQQLSWALLRPATSVSEMEGAGLLGGVDASMFEFNSAIINAASKMMEATIITLPVPETESELGPKQSEPAAA